MPTSTNFYRVALLACVLAYGLVMLGAYVRLSDAGLGCPDWPGCYGRMTVPTADEHVAAANQAYPDRPVEAHKAWKEMAHRYIVGGLVMCVLILVALAWCRRNDTGQQLVLPLMLLALLVLQAALGMWTVTLKLMPLVVTSHLIGGMATLALLFLLVLRQGRHLVGLVLPQPGVLRGLAMAAFAMLIAQIFLGAWTSSNYAALACPDFPTCQGRWWPQTDFREAFTLWRGLGVNYEYGVLENIPRLSVHLAHRLGALITVIMMLGTGLYLLLTEQSKQLRLLAAVLICAVLLQAALGISIVMLHLPLPVAVAHNGGAALLLLVLVALNHAAWSTRN